MMMSLAGRWAAAAAELHAAAAWLHLLVIGASLYSYWYKHELAAGHMRTTGRQRRSEEKKQQHTIGV
jgi:hypothetical protein